MEEEERRITKPSPGKKSELGSVNLRSSNSSNSSFVIWLASQGKTRNTIKTIKNYAIRFGYILDTGDASELITLSPRNRHHALAALAALSKYCGQYGRFVQLRQNYSLKWSSGNDSLLALQRFFDDKLTLDSMLQRIKGMIHVLPAPMGAVVKFACLVGLRPVEACECVRLLNIGDVGIDISDKIQYYNPNRQCLEHFRFPDVFLRQTKKAYISFVTKEQVSGIAQMSCLEGGSVPSWNAIRLCCRRRNINMEMHLCRKIFASHLRGAGMPAEVVDLLQGRVPQSVLVRNYLVPDASLAKRVLESVSKLQKMI